MHISQRRITAFLIACVLIATSFAFSGCSQGSSDYPVTVGNITFEKEPENIVVLSDNMADIISCIGYDVKMVGKSDIVTQKELEVVPSVGSESTPDTARIISQETDVVFCDETLDDDTKKALEDNGVKVVKMVSAETKEELSTVYKSLGTILGGENTGKNKGLEAYNKLIDSMENTKSKYSSGSILNTVCYLYTEDGKLKIAGKDTFIDFLLGYTGAVNVAVEEMSADVEESNLKISNPTYIFYSDSTVLDLINQNPTLKNLNAVKQNKMKEISYVDMSRHGLTSLVNLETMVEFMYPSDDTVNAQAASASETSLTEQYKITIPDGGLKLDDDNNTVKAMQTRLKDLGYISDDENITGYYGQTTEAAVTAFQKNNGIEETGTADKATIEKMFTESAVKAKKAVDA